MNCTAGISNIVVGYALHQTGQQWNPTAARRKPTNPGLGLLWFEMAAEQLTPIIAALKTAQQCSNHFTSNVVEGFDSHFFSNNDEFFNLKSFLVICEENFQDWPLFARTDFPYQSVGNRKIHEFPKSSLLCMVDFLFMHKGDFRVWTPKVAKRWLLIFIKMDRKPFYDED